MTIVRTEGVDKMFWKKKLCPTCKTGKESYDDDKHSEVCPYIKCLRNGRCSFYTPLEKSSFMDFFKKRKTR